MAAKIVLKSERERLAREAAKTKALETLSNLRDCDHGFLSAQAVHDFNIGFGLAADAIKPYRQRANPKDPKGLTFNNGATVGVGYDAASYAEEVSRLLGTGFNPWQSGRGSRLRSACDAIETFVNGECTAYYGTGFGPQPKCRLPRGHVGAHNFPGVDEDRVTA